MDGENLEQLLAQLRRFQMDYQHVEAKRATTDLPHDLWTTLSAFANTEGGLILLGVDESADFAVTGVLNPGRVMDQLQTLAAEMDPPLRLKIYPIDNENGTVIWADVPSVARTQRPCRHGSKPLHEGCYVRVGDRDDCMKEFEVNELMAARTQEDHSRRPAPGERLADELLRGFFVDVRATSRNSDGVSDDEILRRWSVVGRDGNLTLAGLLTLGDSPQTVTPAARLTYRRQPGREAPTNARFSGEHLEGSVGELLETAMSALRRDLKIYQIQEHSGLIDDTDVPGEALREIVSNALVHRSLTPEAERRSVLIEVSDYAVRVVSPGGLFSAVTLETLGLGAISDVRNYALVRICERLRTPGGQRIVESQASGLPAADLACRRRGTAPPLFLDRPDQFEVVLLRGRLPDDVARAIFRDRGFDPTETQVRLLAWALRFEALQEEVEPVRQRPGALDLHFAQRLCVPDPIDAVAAELKELQEARILTQIGPLGHRSWVRELTPTRPAPSRTSPSRGDRLNDLLIAVAEIGGEAGREDAQRLLGLRSTRSAMKWINRAIEKDLLEATTESPYDPGRTYRLTRAGAALAARLSGS